MRTQRPQKPNAIPPLETNAPATAGNTRSQSPDSCRYGDSAQRNSIQTSEMRVAVPGQNLYYVVFKQPAYCDCWNHHRLGLDGWSRPPH